MKTKEQKNNSTQEIKQVTTFNQFLDVLKNDQDYQEFIDNFGGWVDVIDGEGRISTNIGMEDPEYGKVMDVPYFDEELIDTLFTNPLVEEVLGVNWETFMVYVDYLTDDNRDDSYYDEETDTLYEDMDAPEGYKGWKEEYGHTYDEVANELFTVMYWVAHIKDVWHTDTLLKQYFDNNN